MLIETLPLLDRLQTSDQTLAGAHLKGRLATALQQRGWLAPIGYFSHIDVEVLDDVYEEVEVTIDEVAGCYSYPHPYRPAFVFNEPLAEISRYRFQWQPFFDHLASLLSIEPRFASRRRCLVDHHLWYLGDLRVGNRHALAPVFFGRRLKDAPAEQVTSALSDPALVTANCGCVHQLQLSAAPSQGWFASFLGNPGRRYRHQDGGQKSAPGLLSSGVAVRFCPAGSGSPWQLQKTPSGQRTGCRLPCSWLAPPLVSL